CGAAARPELLDDLDQRWPADVFTDNERPPFEDPRVQNLRGAEPGDPLRGGNLLQKAAPDLRVCGRGQKLDRCRASSRTVSQEHNALPALPEAAEQPVYTHLARIRVAQGEQVRHCGPSRCHPAILPLAAQRTPAFPFISCLLQLPRRPPGRPGTAVACLYRLAWPDDALGRERRK